MKIVAPVKQEGRSLQAQVEGTSCEGFSAAAGGHDPRKTAAIAYAHRDSSPDVVLVGDAASAKTVLRSSNVRQAGFTAEIDQIINITRPPVIVLDGPEHRKYRAATARFFAPKVVTTRYLELMEGTAQRLIAQFRQDGHGDLGKMAMEMATAVAAEIVGLTESAPDKLAGRLMALIGGGTKDRSNRIKVLFENIKTVIRFKKFEYHDVRPSIRERRRERREDVISHLLDENYSNLEILGECLTYAGAGMVTTKEFIVVAFWHLIGDEPLKERFMKADRKQQTLIMEEILRLEPILGVLARRSTAELELPGTERTYPAGTLFKVDVRDSNIDERAVGKCPLAIDPDRDVAQRAGGSMFAFGDGVHRCPGHQVAMYESAVFLEALLASPGVRLVTEPSLGWAEMIEGYELYNMEIACDRP